jgi:aspartate/methionine/tyrosine aminotransferase
LRYDPSPSGLDAAREEVVGDYARRGIAARADRIVLTASTSEAYALLFKLLCNPGDEVLAPRPSYPLFEHLTMLDGVVARRYDLEYHGRWIIDVASVERACSPRTRALLIVSPNNPTGSFVERGELDHLAAICRPRDIAIVADEVFADYVLVEGAAASAGHVLARGDILSFSLGGLSKSAGLPQLKLGWIAAGGPGALVADALARLEVVCDSYLSVSTPVQLAAADLIRHGAAVRAQILSRVVANFHQLVAQSHAAPSCDVLHAEGGWYAVIHVPSFSSEEDLVLNLLAQERVLVHPGYFFDFPRESYLVVSLLTPTAPFAEGVSRIFGHLGRGPSDCHRTAS